MLTWAALGGRSLRREAAAIAAQLERDDLDGARRSLPALAGRDPAALDAGGIARAVVESVAENTSDAVVGTLFWGAVGGPAGVAAYRAANTLDAMVGHRTPRYARVRLGVGPARRRAELPRGPRRRGADRAVRAAAGRRLADPAPRRRRAPDRRTPGAWRPRSPAALGLRLGGALSYGGVTELRPKLGDGRAPVAGDIARACRLSSRVGGAALACCAAIGKVRPS